jgi:uncharacterized protein YutE (UPF0331/DUF86 family)
VTVIETERRLLELLRPQYEAQGYLFIEYPHGETLPAALEGFRPDAIAIGPQKKIAIEVKLRRGSTSEAQLEALSQRLRQHPDWELRVIYGDELDIDELSTVAPRPEIEKQIDEAEALCRSGHYRAALILLWAALEAIARTIAPTEARRSKQPREVLEVLERMGRLSFEEASQLRSLLPLRNAVVHGDLGKEVIKDDVVALVKATRAAMSDD